MKWANNRDYTKMDYEPVSNDGLFLWLMIILFVISLFIS